MLTPLVKTLTAGNCKFPDMDIDDLARNAQLARIRAEFATPDEAAKVIGCSRTLVIAWENGSNKLRGSKYLLKAAEIYRVRPEWLSENEGNDGYPWVKGSGHIEPISTHDATNEYALNAPRKVQVRGVASVNEQGFIDQVSDDSDGNGYFLVDVEDRDAYYLKLRGTGSQFVVEPGWYVLLAPNSKPEPSEKVIAKLADGRWFMGAFERHEGGEYVLRRPDGRLAVFQEAEVEYLHPIHGTMSPRQLRRR